MHQLCVFITLNCSLQEKATKWQENREIDGLTTNGVLIMHPRGSFCGGEAKCGMWREVSVGGGVFSMRESRSAQQKGMVVSVNTVPENRELLPTRLFFFCKTCSHPFLQHLSRLIRWSHSVQISRLKFSSNFSSRCVILFSMLVTSYQVRIFSSSSFSWFVRMKYRLSHPYQTTKE